jgi:hypothetical protein
MKKMTKKMMSGGVNASATVQTTPGSNGVKPKMNANVTATPAKMGKGGKMSYGGKVSMKKMGKKK